LADFAQLVTMLREQMNATLSRSDVLKPIAWLIGILATATLALTFSKAPEWLLICVAICMLFAVALYVGAYVFCLIKDRDALRSEKYSLQKMAIEHGILGDNMTGIIDSTATEVQPASVSAISPPKTSTGDDA